MSARARRPTLSDVAALAETSTAVVSYVINDGPRPVSFATRRRVQEAIVTLGYRRNHLAGALSAGRSNLVGLLIPDSSNAFFSELSRHLEGEGRRRGLLTLLGNTGYDRATEDEYENAFSDLRPRGIFVTSIETHLDPPRDCPRVFLHSAPRSSDDPSVVFDDAAAAAAAVEHLLEHGYTDIRCLTGPTSFGPAGRREAGWRRAMERAGLATHDRMHRTSFDRVEAEPSIRELLAAAPTPRALFATTDEQALAALRAAAVLGLRVPEDVAIVGCDGIRETLHGSVRLTTVALPLHELAVRAFDALDALDALDPNGEHGDVPHYVLPGSLVLGESCGPHSP